MGGHQHHPRRQHRGGVGTRRDGGAERVGGPTSPPGLNRLALTATLHCLTGCAVGEVLGMVVGTALGWSGLATIGLALALAVAAAAAFPVNRWLIARGRGHAVVHLRHGHHH